MMRHMLALAALLSLAACSDGDGSDPPPDADNRPPAFTSAATASVEENATAAYQATASDPDGDRLTFSIADGADADRFVVTDAGALSFAPAPNFDLPGDADGDNVYAVQLRVSDGDAFDTLDLAVTVTNSREGIRVTRVGAGFSQPIQVAPIPDDSRVLVIEKTGGVYRLDPATGARTLVRTVRNISTDGERGLLGIAVPPDGDATGEAFIHVTALDGAIELRVISLGSPDVPWPSGYDVVLRVPHPGFNNHNGGWIAFGPDGNLYMAVGDGGGSGDPGNNAQNPYSRLGKILRIARNPDPYAGAAPVYWIPAPDNPFADGGGDPSVFALGLRNPFRASFHGDRLIIGDVGQAAIEEIDLIGIDQAGVNFGWPFREGTQPFRGAAPAGLTDPVSEYPHGDGPREGQSVIGGHVYRGPVASLRGSYVFGDYVSGNIWSIPFDALEPGAVLAARNYERRNADFEPDRGSIDRLVSFGEDAAGNLYLVDLDGEIFMVTEE